VIDEDEDARFNDLEEDSKEESKTGERIPENSAEGMD
jgi:hypothetical protein